MIKVQLLKTGNTIEGFQISGHAGYAEHGHDIVCAAASFLAITVVNSLEVQLGCEGIVKGGEDGYLSYRLPEELTEKQQETAQVIMRTLETGFQNLKEEYPKYISIQNLRIKGGASK
ncbi:MAG: ribosomal-processing cysteine protease Prp [Peptococcaceae bacterium]|nr:ribosomal-processing cysteine protease Prp [Peptococcaceae bacterium]